MLDHGRFFVLNADILTGIPLILGQYPFHGTLNAESCDDVQIPLLCDKPLSQQDTGDQHDHQSASLFLHNSLQWEMTSNGDPSWLILPSIATSQSLEHVVEAAPSAQL